MKKDRDALDEERAKYGSIDVAIQDGAVVNVPACNIAPNPEGLSTFMNNNKGTAVAVSYLAYEAHFPSTIIVINHSESDLAATMAELAPKLST